MIKIVSDTGTLYSIEEGKAVGVDIAPLSITINNQTYRELEEISTEELNELIKEGHIPSSSQPSIGEVLDMYDRNKHCEVLNITMSDGLSGTYGSACMAKDMAENADNITVFKSRTLCGPQRFLVNKAVSLAGEGKSIRDIIYELSSSVENSRSFLIPKDFDFLKRGGRLSTMAAVITGALGLVPVLIQSEDGKKLERFAMKRTFTKAIDSIISSFIEMKVDNSYKIYVSHALEPSLAEKARLRIEEKIAGIEVEILKLSPVFMTQGGPGCLSIQAIKK